MEIKIDPEFKSLIPPLSADERDLLEKSLLSEGCRDALVVWNGAILDGHNRYELCKAHDIQFNTVDAPDNIRDRTDARIWIRNNQAGRRNVTQAWKIELELGNKEDLLRRGKETQGQRTDILSQNDKKLFEPHNTRKAIAKSAGVSTGQVAMAEQVRKEDPGLWNKAKDGDVTISAAYQQIKRRNKEEKRKERREQNAVLVKEKDVFESIHEVNAKFATIVIDPPWDWGDEGDIDQLGRARPTYQTISLERLLELPINKIADIDCHIYLWITNRSLPKGFPLLERWGFRYITCLTWVKPSFGMGNYFRGASEQILFGVKGSQMLKRKDVPTWFPAPRGKKHSSKPDEFYKLVESCSPGPFIDVFGRDQRNGWVLVGSEAI
jgi:N6-adenosine-specific RNA methylase IME4